MSSVSWAFVLVIAEMLSSIQGIQLSRSRLCDDLPRDNDTSCPVWCECCLRNSHYDDTSLVIVCNYTSPLSAFVDDLTKLLQSIKTAGIELKVFDLRGAYLQSIPEVICATGTLEELNLTSVRLTNVTASCIQRLTKLTVLALDHNWISTVSSDIFHGLTDLAEIRLSNNLLIDLQPELFLPIANSTKLTLIDVSYNRLASLDIWPMYFRAEGFVANAIYNRVSTFTNRLHYKYTCNEQRRYGSTLLLENNNVRHITDMITGYGFKGPHDINLLCLLRASAGINLFDNPLTCDCVDYPFYVALSTSAVSASIDSMYCASPPALAGTQLIRAMQHMELFVCDIKDLCPSQCKCFSQPALNFLVIRCDVRGLHELAKAVPALPQLRQVQYSYFVNFSDNNIVSVPPRYYYAKSNIIRLDKNHIQSIDVESLALMVNVSELHLQNNLLQSLPSEIASLPWINLKAIHLYGNPWSCDCHSRWMKDWLKSRGSAVVNRGAITCDTDDIRNGRSLMDISDADFVCGHILSTNEMMWVVIPTVAACVIVVVGTAVMALYAKRKWLFRQFQLHPFDIDECAGEDMTHDVFLSAADEDTDAIMSLHGELQGLGYRVCYHKIDFVPGVSVIDNIDTAIAHSKRTLCYVTPSFLQSDWCKWEFDNALNRDLSTKRHRLIVIVDNVDCSTVTYCSLRQYLQRYTYIERHSDDFLHSLMYSLPQQKLGAQQEEQQGSSRTSHYVDGTDNKDDTEDAGNTNDVDDSATESEPLMSTVSSRNGPRDSRASQYLSINNNSV